MKLKRWDQPFSATRRVRRRIATVASVLGVAAGSVICLPGTAGAAVVGYNGACGGGYSVKNSIDVIGSTGYRYGTVFLTYSSATGKNCVVTIRSNAGEGQIPMGTFIQRDDDWLSYVSDYGNYRTYAAPYTFPRRELA